MKPEDATHAGTPPVQRPVRPLVEPAGFRSRYRSEPGMIGHYPWTYADQGRRRTERPECEYEDLFTADQVRTMLAAERERWRDELAYAEAALADIGDADREPGDDLAWCEARAAQALPRVRAALKA